ncbi:hypothetical protein [Streptomyces sp. NPDC003077]|uniref:hypothetical protein n=1 Tax=Streptomyces sp. NPDC003077 TaxID=3154443 RepID=UPI0033AEBDEC
MTAPTSPPVRLAEDIARQLGRLAELLAQAPPHQAARILGTVLDADEGILGRVTGLLVTGAHFAKDRSARGTFPPEVWLALGRAANALDDIGLDLDEHAETLRTFTGPPRPATTPAPRPVVCALTGRRRG